MSQSRSGEKCAIRAQRVEEAGLTDVELQFTHRVADGMHAAIVRARKPE